MAHEPRLTRELRLLLHGRRTAALGSIADDGSPFVSMVPYAIEPGQALLVLHVSSLAAHTRHLRASPRVSLLVTEPEVEGAPVHALPRVTLDGEAALLEPVDARRPACAAAYLARFPEAEFMTQLGDFRFALVRVTGARHVAGFGAARDVDALEVEQVLRAPADS
ncbi:MAG: Putative heme iron utilization protein [Burkholderiaceae bacterium]|jgi:putative heme iron utilization protein|nr:MAG: Putative heme iron utilization protein [Burkholderiaceae bacterium]